MRLLVEPAVFRYGRCGLTRYYAAVCEGLQREGVELTIPLLSSNCDFSWKFTRYTKWFRQIPKMTGLLNYFSKRWFHLLVRRGKYDCILLTDPGFNAAFLSYKADARFVMIVHDLMSCVTTPDGLYDVPGPGLMQLLYLAARAAKVICISEDTRSALLRHGTVERGRVGLVRTGNLLALSGSAKAEMELPDKYLLFVGERSGRKGFYSLVRALACVLEEEPELHLVCTGSLTVAEKDYIRRHTSLDHVRAVPANDGVLATLYSQAACLVYVSCYEGFGLPVVEAMHYECPVITTTRGALAEIAAPAALIVDPEDLDQLVESIVRLVRDKDLAERLRTAGRLHAQSFQVGEMMSGILKELNLAIELTP